MEIEWKELKVYNKNITKLYEFSDMYKVSNQGQIMNIKSFMILMKPLQSDTFKFFVVTENQSFMYV